MARVEISSRPTKSHVVTGRKGVMARVELIFKILVGNEVVYIEK